MWLITTQLHELNSDFSKVATKTDRLIEDVGKLRTKVDKLHDSLTLAKGFGAAAIILIPICAAFVRWLIGGTLNDIRDRLSQVKSPPAVTAPAPIPEPPKKP